MAMSRMSCVATAVLGLSVLSTSLAQAQDYTLRPTFGDISISTGFLPDPNWVLLSAGGPIQSQYSDFNTGGTFAGYFADAPDFRVHYTVGSEYPMAFFVDSAADTVLLVNTPEGQWHWSDDFTGLNPAIEYDRPLTGQYDIWVGTYASTGESYPDAMLGVTEVSAFSSQDLTNVFFGEDDRTVLDTSQAPWNMIGTVDFDDGGCTGVLVGPSTIVTAGHCIYDSGITSQALSFEAGHNQGNFVASSRILGSHIPAGWRNGELDGYDFAFLFLEQPLGNQLGWMDIGPLSQGEIGQLQQGALEIWQAGYSYDQPSVLTGHLGCPFVRVAAPNELHHECDTVQGDSGSPLFIQAPDSRYRSIGVESRSRTNPEPGSVYPLNVAMHAEFIAAEFATLSQGGGTVSAPVDNK